MVYPLIGDLFRSKAQTLVNTVNCVGVMGKGIALQFKQHFPDMYEDYAARCAARQVHLGRPYLFRRLLPPWILNFPTKEHWRSVSKLSDIVRGLEYVERHYREWGVASLAVPPLGCGEGQLEWRVVGPILHRHLSRLDIPVELYAPYGTSQAELAEAFLAQPADTEPVAAAPTRESKLNPAWVALAEIVSRISREPYHWPVGRTTFQKIAYFATEAGLPTGLHYQAGSYGPFAPEVKSLITRLVNHGLVQEEPIGRMLSVKPGPSFPDAARAYRGELRQWEPTIDRIADLFLRMRTPQAEVAATVYFAAAALARNTKRKPSEAEVLAEVKRWKQRRRPPLRDEDIARSIRNLNVLGWLDVKPSEELPLPKEVLVEA